jgi:hypothetical protein
VTVSLTETGMQDGAVLTPFMTDAFPTSLPGRRSPCPVERSVRALQARSLVTFQIQSTNHR